MDLTKPIPTIEFPSIKDYDIVPKDDALISLSEAGFRCDSQYYNQGVAGSLKDIYARSTVADMLERAQSYLPDDLTFLIYDAYRPIAVQQKLWDCYRSTVIGENGGLDCKLSDFEIDFKTSFFVSKPSYDEYKPSLHNTGGSVDLTLVHKDGSPVMMGTKFDDFSGRAWTNHFEPSYPKCCLNTYVCENRRILYNAMIEAGFTNLPSEWWHYDFGTKFWMYFTGADHALYTGILEHNFPNVMPRS